MSGYFLVHRGMRDHPVFRSSEPLSKYEAWLWLIEQANYRPSRFRHKSQVYDLPRGSLGTSYRAVAKEWRWSVNRVIRELNVWCEQMMIGLSTEHGYMHITIRNYDRYQLGQNANGTATEHQRDADGTPTDTNLNKEIKKESKKRTASPSDEAGDPTCLAPFDVFWEGFPRQRRGNRDKALKAWQRALSRTTQEEIYAGLQRYSQSDDVARGFAKGAESWLNDDGWANDYSLRRSASGVEQPKSKYQRTLEAFQRAAAEREQEIAG